MRRDYSPTRVPSRRRRECRREAPNERHKREMRTAAAWAMRCRCKVVYTSQQPRELTGRLSLTPALSRQSWRQEIPASVYNNRSRGDKIHPQLATMVQKIDIECVNANGFMFVPTPNAVQRHMAAKEGTPYRQRREAMRADFDEDRRKAHRDEASQDAPRSKRIGE